MPGGPSLGALHQRSRLVGVQRRSGGGPASAPVSTRSRARSSREISMRSARSTRNLPGPARRRLRRHGDLEARREMVQERGKGVETGRIHEAVDVVQHQEGGPADPVSSNARRGTAAARIRVPGPGWPPRSRHRFGAIRPIAAARYVRKTLGTSSKSSSVSHATGRSSRATHSARSIVLPYPGGAMTATTGRRGAAVSSRMRRSRETFPGVVRAGEASPRRAEGGLEAQRRLDVR